MLITNVVSAVYVKSFSVEQLWKFVIFYKRIPNKRYRFLLLGIKFKQLPISQSRHLANEGSGLREKINFSQVLPSHFGFVDFAHRVSNDFLNYKLAWSLI